MRGLELKPEEAKEIIKQLIDDLAAVNRVLEKIRPCEVSFILHPPAMTADQSIKLGVSKKKVVKSLVFASEKGGFLVLIQGSRQVDWKKLKSVTETKSPRLATPEEVIKWTGCKIGGVSPFSCDLPIFMDAPILKEPWVNPSGGSSVAGIKLKPSELKKITTARVCELS